MHRGFLCWKKSCAAALCGRSFIALLSMSLRSPLAAPLVPASCTGRASSAISRSSSKTTCGRRPACFAAAKADDGKSPLRGKLVGFGSAGVDYLASVSAYPQPDAKIRTETLEVQGGGNCGNALTAAARLGMQPALFSKIGGDSLGDGILAEFAREGADAHKECILARAAADRRLFAQ